MTEREETEAAPVADLLTANPVDWITLADAFGKNDPIPEWPIIFDLIPKRCDMCIEAFSSAVNLKRHVITHDQDLKMLTQADKESIGEYLKTVNLKTDLSIERMKVQVGAVDLSVLQDLKTYTKKEKIIYPGAYQKAGEMLLVAGQAYQKRGPCPVTVKQLFEILCDASEETSFCYRIDDIVQKFVFQDLDKVSESNVIACTAFLLERKLVDEWSRYKIAEALCNEEDNHKESQAKPVDNKKKKKPKNKNRNPRKQVVDPEPKAAEQCDDNTSKFPIETSIHGSDPSGEDFRDHVAQPDQLPKADLPSDGEKDDNGGSEQEQVEVSSECQQKDTDLEPVEQEVEEEPTRQSKSKINNMKRAERKARKKNDQKKNKKKRLRNKSDTMTLTDSPRPDATQTSDADVEEDRKCFQKEQEGTSAEQQNQDATETSDSLQLGETCCFGAASESSKENKVTNSDILPGDKEEDVAFKQKSHARQVLTTDTTEEQKTEDKDVQEDKHKSDLLQTGETQSGSAPSENCTEPQITEPDKSDSLINPGETGCFGAASESSKEIKVVHGDNLPGDKEEDGAFKQKSHAGQVLTTDTTEEQKIEDKDVQEGKHESDMLQTGETQSGSAPSENRTEAQITQPDQSDSLINPGETGCSGATSESFKEIKVTHGDNLPGDKEEYGAFKTKSHAGQVLATETTEEQENEDRDVQDEKHGLDLQQSSETPSGDEPSENITETQITQPDQSDSLIDPVTLPVSPKSDDVDNLPGDNEDGVGLRQKSGIAHALTTDTTEEQENEDRDVQDEKHGSDLLQSDETPNGIAPSENISETQITQSDQSDSLIDPVTLPVPQKSADGDNLPGDLEEEEGFRQKSAVGHALTTDTAEEQENEDRDIQDEKHRLDLQQSGETPSDNEPSENITETQITQPDQSDSLIDPVTLHMSQKSADGDNLPGDNEDDEGLRQKSGIAHALTTDTTDEQENEDKDVQDEKHGSDLLQSGETPRGIAPSENIIETQITQPHQSDSLIDPVTLPVPQKSADGDNLPGDQEEEEGLRQKSAVGHALTTDTAEEQENEDIDVHDEKPGLDSPQSGETPIRSAPSKNTDTQITQPDQSESFTDPVTLPVSQKSADAEDSQEGPETKKLHSQSEYEKEANYDPTIKESNKDEFQCLIASLVDDLDTLKRVKEEFEQALQKMSLRLQDLQSRYQPRNLYPIHLFGSSAAMQL